MDKQELKTYTEVNDNQIPLVVAIFIIIGGLPIAIIFFKTTKDGFVGLGFLCLFALVSFQAFRKRTCPNCKQQMRKNFVFGLIPEYHYCSTCKLKIKTGVGNSRV